MQFPEPTVDIEEIKQKYHAIVGAEGGDGDEQTSTDAQKEKKGKKKTKKKKGKQ
ncbi:hypothetical protein [Thiocapsa bogorovii]|uniref:hypothetical protein n=1 Tax=Thiocapsa bogorovii TaxID=521689 RepID=UPI001E4FC1A3|nr:hypothetical protein [Thiocapsa bogorovii]UHD17793.1 hypothetical protein LT988_07020 [Thiocapsa bogorovii]